MECSSVCTGTPSAPKIFSPVSCSDAARTARASSSSLRPRVEAEKVKVGGVPEARPTAPLLLLPEETLMRVRIDARRLAVRVWRTERRRLRVLDAPLLHRLRREALDGGGEGCCCGRARRVGLVGAEQLGVRVLAGATRRTHVLVRLGGDAVTVLGRPVTRRERRPRGGGRVVRRLEPAGGSGERPRLPWTVADVPARIVDVVMVDDRGSCLSATVCDTLRYLRRRRRSVDGRRTVGDVGAAGRVGAVARPLSPGTGPVARLWCARR